MVFANVLLLKTLLLSCINVTYMSRWHCPAQDGGVWLRSALATETREDRRKWPERRVDWSGTSPGVRVSLWGPAARQSLQITTQLVLQIKWPTLCVRTMYNVWQCSSIHIWTKHLFRHTSKWSPGTMMKIGPLNWFLLRDLSKKGDFSNTYSNMHT